jgi:hypothetical protein
MKIFSGGVPLSLNFQRAFCMQIEKVAELLIGERKTQESKTDLNQFAIKETIVDVISSLDRPLAVEIEIPPQPTSKKLDKTFKRCSLHT